VRLVEHRLMNRKPCIIGFTLIEVLVVVAIIAVLAAILFPIVSSAKTRAKVIRIHAELAQVANAVQMYCDDNNGKPPLANESCSAVSVNDYYELPKSLYRYLSTKRFWDPYNPGRTYKYLAPGWGYVNNSLSKIKLYVPVDYPQCEVEESVAMRSQEQSPVKWVIWSVGPAGACDLFEFHRMRLPIRKQRWYPFDHRGLIVRMSDGRRSP
jgi:prepilin-type N-terminal cleavage/methylation domain-containing protein